MENLKFINRMLAKPLVLLVLIYQKTLSPDHGLVSVFYPFGVCKSHPTCSEYAKEVLQSEGVLALPKIIMRVLTCY